MVVFLT
jgi:hypothetical protein